MNKKILILGLSLIGAFLSAASFVPNTYKYTITFIKLDTGETVSKEKDFSSLYAVSDFIEYAMTFPLIKSAEEKPKTICVRWKYLPHNKLDIGIDKEKEEAGSVTLTLNSSDDPSATTSTIDTLMKYIPKDKPTIF